MMPFISHNLILNTELRENLSKKIINLLNTMESSRYHIPEKELWFINLALLQRKHTSNLELLKI